MLKKSFATLFVILIIPNFALSEDYIYFSQQAISMLRAEIGYAWLDLSPESKGTRRLAQAVTAKNEWSIMGKPNIGRGPFDGLYFNLALGKMTSKPLTTGPLGEGVFSVYSEFGYNFLYGYRGEAWSGFGGIKFDWSFASIGGTMLDFNSSFPLMVRMEYLLFGDKRLLASAWTNFHSHGLYGIDLAVPLSERWWIYSNLNQRRKSVGWEGGSASKGSLTAIGLGIRVGPYY